MLFEYALTMSNGTEFFTGGFESIDSLRACIGRGEVDGSWVNDAEEPWHPTWLNPACIVGITDLRENT